MTASKNQDGNTPVDAVPPVAEDDSGRKAGPGEVVVTSPTGARSIVPDYRADSLKSQGYRVGG
jgi:hypothetical protein